MGTAQVIVVAVLCYGFFLALGIQKEGVRFFRALAFMIGIIASLAMMVHTATLLEDCGIQYFDE